MFARKTILVLCAAPICATLLAGSAFAESKPCPAQSYDRGTDPQAAGGHPAQSYDRGTDVRAAGGHPAQSYDRGTDPRAAGCK